MHILLLAFEHMFLNLSKNSEGSMHLKTNIHEYIDKIVVFFQLLRHRNFFNVVYTLIPVYLCIAVQGMGIHDFCIDRSKIKGNQSISGLVKGSFCLRSKQSSRHTIWYRNMIDVERIVFLRFFLSSFSM